jgi:hypothetical protein
VPETGDDEALDVIDVDAADRQESFDVDGLDEEVGDTVSDAGIEAQAESSRGPRRGRDRGPRRERPGMADGNGRPPKSDAREIYASVHRITHPDVPPAPPEARRRTSPFKAFAATVESGLLFDSQQPGVTDTVPLPPPSEVPEKVGRRVMPEELGLAPEVADDTEPMAESYAREEIADEMDDSNEDHGDDMPPEDESAVEELAAEDGVESEEVQAPPGEVADGSADGDKPGRRRRRRGRGGRGRGRREGAPVDDGAPDAQAEGAPPQKAERPERPEPGNERPPDPQTPEDDDEYMPGNTIEPPSARAARPPRAPRPAADSAAADRSGRRRGGRGRGGRGRRPGGGGRGPVAAAGSE